MHANGQRALIELLRGKGAHVSPVVCVQDMSAELAGRRDEGYPHSIWQIVCHMNYWMDYELRRIKGALQYPQHADESWPNDRRPTGEAQWKETVARFAALVDELATVAESGSKLWEDQVPATHATHSQQASSVLAVLWQTVVHNSYHTGQMALLRRHSGAWPPTGGGDTW